MYEGRHLKFVGLCGGGGNTGPARSRASGQDLTANTFNLI